MYDGINNFTLPIWPDAESQATRGQDLLGLRNVAQTIGNDCLNGITTISPMVRNLSLRSWYIKMFKEYGLEQGFNEFTDNLERTVAIGTVLHKPNINGVVGITKALEIIERDEEHIIIEKLVKTAPVMTTYKGPAEALDISFDDNGNIGLTTDRGLPLADTVMTQVKNTEIVKKIIKNKKIHSFSREELNEIGQILSVDQVPDEERKLLLDIIIPKEPSSIGWDRLEINRIATYTLLLHLVKSNEIIPSEADFFKIISNPELLINTNLNYIINGWFCFLSRDLIALSHEKVLELVVNELKTTERVQTHKNKIINNVISDIGSIEEELHYLDIISDRVSFANLSFLEVYNKVKQFINDGIFLNKSINRWSNTTLDESALIDRLNSNSSGLVALIWIIAYFRYRAGIEDEIMEIKLLSRGGAGRFGLNELIFPNIEKWKNDDPKYSQVIGELVEMTVDQHAQIAWSRIETGDMSILLVDGENWQYKDNSFKADSTASRLKQALGWLKQLQLIDNRGITTDGDDVLNRGYDSLAKYYSEQI